MKGFDGDNDWLNVIRRIVQLTILILLALSEAIS